MPNRIIKESFTISEKINALSDFEFRLWCSLLVSADDAGRGDARPAIIKGRAFPLRERVTIKDIDNALHGLAAKGCVSLYTVGGKPYFWFPTWAAHQRVRDVKTKYPSPEESDEAIRARSASRQSAAICGELRQSAASCGNLRPESESESEIESEIESEVVSAEPSGPAPENAAQIAEEGELPVIQFSCLKGETYCVTQEKLNDWQSAYPAVDVLAELRKMRVWLDANSVKAKTKGGMPRFIVNWLSREQNRGGPTIAASKPIQNEQARNEMFQDVFGAF